MSLKYEPSSEPQDLYDVTSKLRKEQEQEEKLAERLHEQVRLHVR